MLQLPYPGPSLRLGLGIEAGKRNTSGPRWIFHGPPPGHQLRSSVGPFEFAATTMSKFEATRDLSIPDLLRLLKEKLGLEQAKLRIGPFPSAVSAASLESAVSRLITVVTWGVV